MERRIGLIIGTFIMAMSLLSCNLTTSVVPQPTPTEIIPPTPANTPTDALPPTFAPPLALPTTTELPPTLTFTEIPSATSTIMMESPTPTNTLLPYNPNASPTPPPTIPSGYHTATPHPYYTATLIAPAPTARTTSDLMAVQFTPAIDGDWSEWPNAETASGYVVFGGSNWVNSGDLNSSFKASYDGNYFYIAVKVIDDIYAQNTTGYMIYLGDSIEVLLDTDLDGDYYVKGLSSDDYQLGFSPGKGNITGPKEAYLWYPASKRGARSQVVIASRAIDGGYMVEAAIPWAVFDMTPVSGKHYGFALSVSDDDNTSQTIQESMVSSVSTRRFLNPTTWGDIVLQ